MNPQLLYSYIIVNYNLAESVVELVNSIFLLPSSNNAEVIIIDNASRDVAELEVFVSASIFTSKLQLFRNTSNLGFGAACNIGAEKALGEYLIFINPDSLINSDFIPYLKERFRENPKLGIAGVASGKVTNRFDFSAGFFPSILFELFQLFYLGRYLEAFLVKQKHKALKSRDYLIVDWVLGAFLFIRNTDFKAIGGFDKRFFIFFEEMDLCKKIKLSEKEVQYFPNLVLNHEGSKVVSRDYEFFTYHFTLSKYLFLGKHFAGVKVFVLKLLLFFSILTQTITILPGLIKSKPKAIQKFKGFSKFILRGKV